MTVSGLMWLAAPISSSGPHFDLHQSGLSCACAPAPNIIANDNAIAVPVTAFFMFRSLRFYPTNAHGSDCRSRETIMLSVAFGAFEATLDPIDAFRAFRWIDAFRRIGHDVDNLRLARLLVVFEGAI